MSPLKTKIHDFFFPPSGSPMWVRILPYAVLGVLTILLLIGAAYGWDYTNSPEFCGSTCHTMPPEYTSYLVSPHARVDCVDCHIGRGLVATRVTRKAGDIRFVVDFMFHHYEYPIRVSNERPARETCEKCHYPQKFSDDSLRTIQRYQPDKNNTLETIYLNLKTGGGSKRQGLGKGIHWHIETKVEYLATDPEEQNIPYVRVYEDDGSITEYVDIESGLDPATIDESQLKEMDCITCHNRISHLVETPEDTVDTLMAQGIIASDIPDIKRIAVDTYSKIYSTTAEGVSGLGGIKEYYTTYYPDYYAANQEKVDQAITALQEAYANSVYPEQKSDWTTHPDNIGHKNSSGCFRCHDGKHLNADNEAIPMECNLCHSIPVVSGPQDFVTNIEISKGPEPDSHKNSNWIALHRDAFDQTCSNCHTTDNPGGTDNTSFCSNSACHGSAWTYAGFDAPKLREILLSQLPVTPTAVPTEVGGPITYETVIGPLFQARCSSCHGSSNSIKGLNLTTYEGAMKGSENGPVIIPGDVEGSRLVQIQSGKIPHFGQLSPEELALVEEWIQTGAPEFPTE
jgi:nitrate/TMAO reductase-like tetraheme cytochrome c subunit